MKEKIIISPQNYKKAIKNDQPIIMDFQKFDKDIEFQITKVFHYFLANYDIIYYKTMLISTIKELINNAVKANLKRLYFSKNNLNIYSPLEYKQGMESFKKETFNLNDKSWFENLTNSDLFVRTKIEKIDDFLQISVINNMPILPEELEKITVRIEKAFQYHSIAEAFTDVLDESEGAGLGLIMTLMLLKNSGFKKNSFEISKKDQTTVATLRLPINKTEAKICNKLTEEIINEIESIPALPNNIAALQQLCTEKECMPKQLAKKIRQDYGLTTNILKIANSSGISETPVNTIDQAIKIIPLEQIDSLLKAGYVKTIMDEKYKRYEELWTNSYQKAFFVKKLANLFNKEQQIEEIYLASLISEIGNIILLSLNKKMLENLDKIAGQDKFTEAEALEEITLGISHNTLGSKICKRWNFSPLVCEIIHYYNRPHLAPKEFQEQIYLVYLANAFVEISQHRSCFNLLDEDVLNYFEINNEEKINKYIKEFRKDYEEQK